MNYHYRASMQPLEAGHLHPLRIPVEQPESTQPASPAPRADSSSHGDEATAPSDEKEETFHLDAGTPDNSTSAETTIPSEDTSSTDGKKSE